MSIKKQVCKICNCNFDIKSSKKYLVKTSTFKLIPSGLTNYEIYDAMDCPQCGCQQLLCVRYPLIDDKNNKKS